LDNRDSFNTMILPMWLVFANLGSNAGLNFLNIFWFAKMVQALMKQFKSPSSTLKVLKRSSEKEVGGHID
jgi:hypothetical protein